MQEQIDQAGLQEYQDLLVMLLSTELSSEAVLSGLKDDPIYQSLRDYIDSFDQDMIAVAQELISVWGVKE